MLDDDQMEELTINSIIELWFRYEPKNDSVSEIRKNKDKKIIITALFQNGALSGELKTRIDINERLQDVYPNYITGKFRTHNEDEAYRGIPYTKTVTTEVVFCKLIDIKNFLELKKERPPSDSPLFKKLQILGDFAEQADNPNPRSKTILERQEAKVIENGASNQTKTKPLNNLSDNTGFSGLLNIPKKTYDWFSVIDDMTRDFYNKFGKIPNEIQAWGALWENPPEGYIITTDKDRGETCLKMPGISNLGNRAFSIRWKKYTKNIF